MKNTIEKISAYSPMQFINENQFRTEKNSFINSEVYSCCYAFSETWVQLMQEKISNGCKLKDIYKETYSEVDCLYGEVTGYMRSQIEDLVTKHWVNGHALLRLLKKDQLSIWNPLRWLI